MSLLREVRLDNTDKVLELLQSPPYDLNQIDPKTGNSLLHFAIKNLNITILKALLEASNVSPLNKNILGSKDGFPPIISALNMNFVDGITLLLQHKVDCNFRFQDGRSIMHHAVVQNTPQVLKQLISIDIQIIIILIRIRSLSEFYFPNGYTFVTRYSSGSNRECSVSIREGWYNIKVSFLPKKKIFYQNMSMMREIHYSTFVRWREQGIFQMLQSVKLWSLRNRLINQPKIAQFVRLVNTLNKVGNGPLHIAALNERSLIIDLFVRNKELLQLDQDLKNRAGLTYSQILTELKNKQIQEKEEIIQRKKEISEDKSRRSQQKREEVMRQNLREEEEKKLQKVKQEKAQVLVEAMTKRTKYIFGGLLLLVFVSFYICFEMAVQNKKNNIIM